MHMNDTIELKPKIQLGYQRANKRDKAEMNELTYVDAKLQRATEDPHFLTGLFWLL